MSLFFTSKYTPLRHPKANQLDKQPFYKDKHALNGHQFCHFMCNFVAANIKCNRLMSKFKFFFMLAMAIVAAVAFSCGSPQSRQICIARFTVSGDNAQAVQVAADTLTATRQQAEPSPGFITVSLPVELRLTACIPAGSQSSQAIELHLFTADGNRIATLTYTDDDHSLADFLGNQAGAVRTVTFTGIMPQADFQRLSQATVARITGFSFIMPRTRALLPAVS